jgi:hypothetical protein
VNEQQAFDVSIVASAEWKAGQVSTDELRLLSSFFPEILKELMARAEPEKE